MEEAVEVVSPTVRAHPSGPGFLETDADVYMALEPLAHATLAREGGWRDTPKTPPPWTPGR